MTTISRYLEAEVRDPTLPRDAFEPPSDEENYDDDVDLSDIIDVEPDDSDE